MPRRAEHDTRVEHSGEKLTREYLEIESLELSELIRGAPIKDDTFSVWQRLIDARHKTRQLTGVLPDGPCDVRRFDDQYLIFGTYKFGSRGSRFDLSVDPARERRKDDRRLPSGFESNAGSFE